MKKLMLVLAMALSGCITSAQMYETRGRSQYAPENERPGGRVQYRLNGPGALVQARREDAYKQMYEHCDGRYRIVSESDINAGSVSSTFGSSNTTASATSSGNATAYVAGDTAYANGSGSSSGVSRTQGGATGFSSGVFLRLIDFECDGGASARPQPTESSSQMEPEVNASTPDWYDTGIGGGSPK
jgi:hypothetical protein